MSKSAIVLGFLSITVLFHICILLKIIPYELTWGGRLQNDTEMYIFETISIVINLFLALVLLMKGGQIRFKFSNGAIRIILWIYFAVFALNTMGNLFAETGLEKTFSILTLILAILIWQILHNKKEFEHDKTQIHD